MFIFIISSNAVDAKRLVPVFEKAGARKISEESASDYFDIRPLPMTPHSLDKEASEKNNTSCQRPKYLASEAVFCLVTSEAWTNFADIVSRSTMPAIVILPYSNPTRYLSRNMSKGIDPYVSLNTWADASKKILNIYDQQPDICTPINIDNLEVDLSQLFSRLNKFYKVSLNADTTEYLLGNHTTPGIIDLIAAEALSQDSATITLLGDLHSRTSIATLAPTATHHDCAKMFHDYIARATGDSHVTQLQYESETLRNLLTKCRRHQELLLSELSELGDELSEYYLKFNGDELARLRSENPQISALLERKSQELAELYSSSSWKITSPFRAMVTIIGKWT